MQDRPIWRWHCGIDGSDIDFFLPQRADRMPRVGEFIGVFDNAFLVQDAKGKFSVPEEAARFVPIENFPQMIGAAYSDDGTVSEEFIGLLDQKAHGLGKKLLEDETVRNRIFSMPQMRSVAPLKALANSA